MLDRPGGVGEDARVVRVERQRLAQERIGRRVLGGRFGEDAGAGLQVDVVGRDAARPLAPDARQLRRLDLRLDHGGDALGDAVLEREDLGEGAVVALGPEVRARRAVHQLGADPEPVAGAPDGPPEQVAHAELLRHRARVAAAVAEEERGRARENGERPEAPERRDDVLRHPVGEVARRPPPRPAPGTAARPAPAGRPGRCRRWRPAPPAGSRAAAPSRSSPARPASAPWPCAAPRSARVRLPSSTMTPGQAVARRSALETAGPATPPARPEPRPPAARPAPPRRPAAGWSGRGRARTVRRRCAAPCPRE